MKFASALSALVCVVGMTSALPAGTKTEQPRSYMSGGQTCIFTCPQTIGSFSYVGQPNGNGSCQYTNGGGVYGTCIFSTTTGRYQGGGAPGLDCPSDAGAAQCSVGGQPAGNQFKRSKINREAPEIERRQFKFVPKSASE